MTELGKCLGYTNHVCPNCGRMRVEKWESGKHICEKCSWCIEDEEYYFVDFEDEYDDCCYFVDFEDESVVIRDGEKR